MTGGGSVVVGGGGSVVVGGGGSVVVGGGDSVIGGSSMMNVGGGGSVIGGDAGAVVGGSLAIGPTGASFDGSDTPCRPATAGVLAAVPKRPAVAVVGGEGGCVAAGTEADWAVLVGTAVPAVVVGGTVGEPAKTSGSLSDENGTRSTTAANATIPAMVPITGSTRRAGLLVRITLARSRNRRAALAPTGGYHERIVLLPYSNTAVRFNRSAIHDTA